MDTLTRRTFLSGMALPLLSVAQTKRPNIVFIILDDLGYGDFGCYGQKLIQTPNVDRFSKQSMRFTDAYAGCTVCAPSRCALMTGLHNGHGAIRANAGTAPIAATDVTLSNEMHKVGYKVGGFGKWGLGDKDTSGDPMKHGFDEFVGYYHQVHAHSYYPDFLWDSGKRLELPNKEYSADIIAARSLEFVRKHKDQPFFLYACYTLPHAKFEPPNESPYEKEKWPEGAKKYAAMVTRADAHIGSVLKLLDELKLSSNTIVYVTSDNGAPFGGGGEDKGFELFQSNGILRGQKGQFYEGGIRIPMMVRWPGHIAAGSKSSLPTTFYDVFPTLAEATGTKAPAGIDGISILPTLTGKGKQASRESLYWELHLWEAKTGKLRAGSMKQGARSGTWKAVREKADAPIELFDLSKDPGEKSDVTAANPEVVARMERVLSESHQEPRSHAEGSMQWVK